MTLVENWRDAWRWFSLQAMALTAAVQASWAVLPPELKQQLPDGMAEAGSIALLLLGIGGRLVKQGSGPA